MYISKLRISGIKCIGQDEEVCIDFQRPDGSFKGWTVLAGRNGSGKSTLLRAMALATVGPGLARSLISLAGWVSKGRTKGHAEVVLATDDCDRFVEGGAPPHGVGTLSRLDLEQRFEGGEPRIGASYGPDSGPKTRLENGPWSESPKGWFIAGHGPFRRMATGETSGPAIKSRSDHWPCLVSLFDGSVTLTGGLEMLRELHMRRLERRTGAGELLEGVLGLLNDGLLPDDTNAVKVDSDGLWVEQNGVRFLLESMSDGYQITTALVLELARRLRDRYGTFNVERTSSGECRVRHPGVVLIDEIDSHLHVSWQKSIGYWLKTRFPELQFIVTTHSPFVCQAADPRGLIRLPGPGDDFQIEHVPEDVYYTVVNGGADEAVQTELFGLERTHSNDAERLRAKIAKLESKDLRSKITCEENQELDRLRTQLPRNPSTLLRQALRKLEQ